MRIGCQVGSGDGLHRSWEAVAAVGAVPGAIVGVAQAVMEDEMEETLMAAEAKAPTASGVRGHSAGEGRCRSGVGGGGGGVGGSIGTQPTKLPRRRRQFVGKLPNH